MSIIGFVPNPEMAPALVAWVQALADKDEDTTFLCLETGFDGRTTQAVREALGEKNDGVSTLIAIDDPMPVARVREYVRKRNIRLLVTGSFALPAVGGKEQTADELVRAASCRTFALLYGEKAPSEIKRVLFIFKSTRQAQRFLSVHAAVYNLFNLGRHLFRDLRQGAFTSWNSVTA